MGHESVIGAAEELIRSNLHLLQSITNHRGENCPSSLSPLPPPRKRQWRRMWLVDEKPISTPDSNPPPSPWTKLGRGGGERKGGGEGAGWLQNGNVKRKLTYTHALPSRNGTQRTQGPERSHRTERRDIGSTDQSCRQVDQRQLIQHFSQWPIIQFNY